jgi:ABC-type bacteriocin/lantibiotic exporter with double-glycine peptidase domain
LFFTRFHILKVFDDILTTNIIKFAILYMLRNDHSREVKTKEREKNGWERERRILTCSAIYTVQTVLHINNLKLCRLSEFKMHDWDTSFGSFFGNECRTGRTVFKALYVSIFLYIYIYICLLWFEKFCLINIL